MSKSTKSQAPPADVDDVEEEAIGLIATAVGTDAVTLSDRTIDQAWADFDRHTATMLSPTNPRLQQDVATWIGVVGRYLLARRDHSRRRGKLAALVGCVPGGDRPAAPVPSVGAELRNAVVTHRDQAGLVELQRVLDQVEGKIRERLDLVGQSITREIGVLNTDGSWGRKSEPLEFRHRPGGDADKQHRFLGLVRPHLEARRRTLRTLAIFERARTEAVEVQGAAVDRVTADAGGDDVVAAAVREARTVAGTWIQPDRDALLVGQGIAEIDTQLARLGLTVEAAAASGSAYAATLPARRAELVQRRDELNSQADARQTAGVRDIIARACTGDEPARAELEAIARGAPAHFPAGFSNALRGAQWILTPSAEPVLEAVVEEIVSAQPGTAD